MVLVGENRDAKAEARSVTMWALPKNVCRNPKSGVAGQLAFNTHKESGVCLFSDVPLGDSGWCQEKC